ANLIGALRSANPGATLVSVSSASVMGSTQRRAPPVRPQDPVSPSDAYSASKIEAETLVAASGLKHCVLRLAAVLPTCLDLGSLIGMVRVFFDMPLDARCEIVVDLDVAYALVSAAENLVGSGELAGATLFIAGGAAGGCQIHTRDLVRLVFVPVGLRSPADELFAQDLDSYYLDWYDTDLTQGLLRYQRHSADDWRSLIARKIRPLRPLIVLFRPAIMAWLERQSPRSEKCADRQPLRGRRTRG
ncbi:MAG: sugar nucleotide-binding protein, partial [Spirochaetaceae bacterium]|nr:sugar nucleotide-binding protein [Spirochaetaceae bacterium]